MHVEKVMILCHLLMHQDSFLSTLLTKELYEYAKLRNEKREFLQQEVMMTNEETISLTTDETISLTTDAPVEYLPQQVSTGTQTDLTAIDIAVLEADYTSSK